MGLMIYFMIGAILAFVQISDADELHKKGLIDDESYIIMRYKKPLAFSTITMFWLPTVLYEMVDFTAWRKRKEK